MKIFLKNLIGVEGHSFSGKTTLINDITKNESTEIQIIKEHDVYAGGAENFPKFPFKNYKEAKEDIDYFLNLEEKRFKDAIKLFKKHKTPILIDRTILSVILFQKYIRDNKPDWINSYRYSLKVYQDAIEDNKIFIPNRMIYMEPYDEVTFLDRTRRGVSVEFYSKVDTLNYMKKHYLNILQIGFNGNRSIILRSQDGYSSRNKLVDIVKNFAKQDFAYKDQGFRLHKLFK